MKLKRVLLVTPFLLAGCSLFGGAGSTDDGDTAPAVSESVGIGAAESGGETKVSGGVVGVDAVQVGLKARNFTFGQDEIRVKRGDKVVVTIDNVDGTHDFQIDEFGVNSGLIAGGESRTVEFVADKAGSFEYYCGVGNHRQLGMKGTLIVE